MTVVNRWAGGLDRGSGHGLPSLGSLYDFSAVGREARGATVCDWVTYVPDAVAILAPFLQELPFLSFPGISWRARQ